MLIVDYIVACDPVDIVGNDSSMGWRVYYWHGCSDMKVVDILLLA